MIRWCLFRHFNEILNFQRNGYTENIWTIDFTAGLDKVIFLKKTQNIMCYIYIYMMYEKYAALFYRRIVQEFPGWCNFSDTAQALGTGHGLGSGGHKEDSIEFLVASINI